MEHNEDLEPEQQLQELLNQLATVPRAEWPQRFQAFFDTSIKQEYNSSLEDFAIYYLAALRQHTELHFRASWSNESETPKSQTPVRQVTSELTPPDQNLNESQLSQISIVPGLKQHATPQSRPSTSGASGQFCSTPQSSISRSVSAAAGIGGVASGSGASGSGSTSFCLGDFIPSVTPNLSYPRSKKKCTSQTPTTSQDIGINRAQKPRRRVLPMTISKSPSTSSSFGDTSSFSHENNLSRLSQNSELLERSQSSVLEQETRKTLLLHKQQIKIEAPVVLTSVDQQQQLQDEEQPASQVNATINLEQVKDVTKLQQLATIYALLIDLNLVPNILSELSYAMQLLNIRDGEETGISPKFEPTSSALFLLSQHKECVYFAVQLLEQQSQLLLQLDAKSLTIFLQYERISLLPKLLQEQLELACQRKQLQLKKEADLPETLPQNVYYQHDKDSRDNFPTQHEFGAFKSQRDLFYTALKHWEMCHLSRTFNFTAELGSRVREIFKQSEHAVNMSHFANLFVSQLLMSSRDTLESPEELGLKLDQQRLNRLAQRLVTSNSSVEDQFPRTQAFFRDFISQCGSVAFLVQLQLALYVQLMRHNDSSFELLQLQSEAAEEMEVLEQQETATYVVRAQALAEMLLLAKFLGYVCALPYTRCNSSAVNYICPQQLQLRRQFQPPFELRIHLERAMRQGKLLITLPWMSQYLIMLDLTTLQLPESLATLELLYDLYANLLEASLQPCAAFITRSCLGWLLESQPVLCSGYYSQRRTKQPSEANGILVKECLRSLSFALDQGSAAFLLEELLPVACPSLHEFRVTITPSHRQVQRNGRYRYITTRLEQLSSSSRNPVEPAASDPRSPQQQQRKLNDAFLHSQTASIRRLMEFVVERSFKCVVKDAQQQILLPSKAAADAQVNGLTSTQQPEIQRELVAIYQQARTHGTQQWTEQVPVMLQKRIEQSLQALLPANTNDILRRRYAHLIKEQAQSQIQQWFESSVVQSNFYHGDLQELASKICRSNKNNVLPNSASAQSSNELNLADAGNLSVSSVLHELQQWVHCMSIRPEHLFRMCELEPLLERTLVVVRLPQLPTYFYQLVGTVLIRLIQLILCRRPQLITQPVISFCCDIWLAPQMRPAGLLPGIFDSLFSINFVEEFTLNLVSMPMLKRLLTAMLDAGVMQTDELNRLIMPIFKETWSPSVWAALSQLLQQLSQVSNDTDDEDSKANLFMEMLADFSRDLERF